MVAKALFQGHHHSKQREKRKAQQYGKDMRDYLKKTTVPLMFFFSHIVLCTYLMELVFYM